MGPKKSASLPFTLWADNTAGRDAELYVKVVSDETGDVRPEPGSGHINTVTERVTLTNKGLGEMKNVRLSLLSSNKTQPAPAWVCLNTPSSLGDIPVGETRHVDMGFSPHEDVAVGNHTFYLRIEADNHAARDIGLYVAVPEAGEGDVLFKVTNLYTGTIDPETNQVVQGLKDARIRVRNEDAAGIEESMTTDALGEAYFEALPAGRYQVRVTPQNHQEYTGRLWVKPGISVTHEVFLGYNLVTVEWSVNEITIEDKYEIVLNLTYETDVPAAVVILEPASINLPLMKRGDVFNGEFSMVNHGLIQAEAITFTLPEDDAYYRYEIPGGLPETLEAKSLSVNAAQARLDQPELLNQPGFVQAPLFQAVYSMGRTRAGTWERS